jgi:hypothetical protein
MGESGGKSLLLFLGSGFSFSKGVLSFAFEERDVLLESVVNRRSK